MKERIESLGKFNNWNGYIGIYFTKKQLRQIAHEINVPFKDIENMKIQEVYERYVKQQLKAVLVPLQLTKISTKLIQL